MTAKEGIRIYGQKAINAVVSEYCQLDDMKTFEPQIPNKLMDGMKREALSLVTIVR